MDYPILNDKNIHQQPPEIQRLYAEHKARVLKGAEQYDKLFRNHEKPDEISPKYSELYSFLLNLYETNGKFDETIRKDYIRSSDLIATKIIPQGRLLLQENPFPWEFIHSRISDSMPATEEGVRKWLTDILDLAGKTLQNSND